MIIGESLSTLIDDKQKKLDFHMEETDTEEAQWLKGLTKTFDDIGPLSDLQRDSPAQEIKAKPAAPAKRKKAPKATPKITTIPPRGIIEEVSSSDDDDDLVPYAKASDPEDSDDDGETAAGGRLLHLLQIVNADNVMVIVTRWYGGVHLGPARFTHINNAARILLDQEGYISKNENVRRKKGSK